MDDGDRNGKADSEEDDDENDCCSVSEEAEFNQLNDSLTSMNVNQSEKLLSAAKINDKKTQSSPTALHHLSLSLYLSLRVSPSDPLQAFKHTIKWLDLH
ncbi:hypothetical protein ACFX1X_023044 [Malus domestica]